MSYDLRRLNEITRRVLEKKGIPMPMEQDERPLRVPVAEALGWTVFVPPTSPASLWDDVAIAAALEEAGFTHLDPKGRLRIVPRYDTDWSAIGPVITKLRISLYPWQQGWAAELPQGLQTPGAERIFGKLRWTGALPKHTPQRAACEVILCAAEMGYADKLREMLDA